MKYATGRAARVAAFVLRDREMAESMEHLSIPIKWDEVANAQTLFANHLLVQGDQQRSLFESFLQRFHFNPPAASRSAIKR